jgi:hypothetical protein
MSLVEFLAPLRNGTHQQRVAGLLYCSERYEAKPSLTVEDIRKALGRARVARAARINVADVLAKSGANIDSAGERGRQKLWALTDTGRTMVRAMLGLPDAEPEVEHDVGTLEATIHKITDADVQDYLREGVKCLQVGGLRACVVFVWSGAIRTLQEELLALGAAAVTAAVQKHDPKARAVSTLDHFAYIKDDLTLQAAQDLGLLDKNEKEALKEALGLRNKSGHPGKYRPGAKKVSSFIEDVVSILF